MHFGQRPAHRGLDTHLGGESARQVFLALKQARVASG
jgi:hypothetical protein